jgi:hypothetical protein
MLVMTWHSMYPNCALRHLRWDLCGQAAISVCTARRLFAASGYRLLDPLSSGKLADRTHELASTTSRCDNLLPNTSVDLQKQEGSGRQFSQQYFTYQAQL